MLINPGFCKTRLGRTASDSGRGRGAAAHKAMISNHIMTVRQLTSNYSVVKVIYAG